MQQNQSYDHLKIVGQIVFFHFSFFVGKTLIRGLAKLEKVIFSNSYRSQTYYTFLKSGKQDKSSLREKTQKFSKIRKILVRNEQTGHFFKKNFCKFFTLLRYGDIPKLTKFQCCSPQIYLFYPPRFSPDRGSI